MATPETERATRSRSSVSDLVAAQVQHVMLQAAAREADGLKKPVNAPASGLLVIFTLAVGTLGAASGAVSLDRYIDHGGNYVRWPTFATGIIILLGIATAMLGIYMLVQRRAFSGYAISEAYTAIDRVKLGTHITHSDILRLQQMRRAVYQMGYTTVGRTLDRAIETSINHLNHQEQLTLFDDDEGDAAWAGVYGTASSQDYVEDALSTFTESRPRFTDT